MREARPRPDAVSILFFGFRAANRINITIYIFGSTRHETIVSETYVCDVYLVRLELFLGVVHVCRTAFSLLPIFSQSVLEPYLQPRGASGTQVVIKNVSKSRIF